MTTTLRQLSYVVALGETGHFGRAAEQCRVTQPALSQQIRQLEESCGSPLFDRLGKSVRPTPLGRELIERARPILEMSAELDAFLAGRHGRPGRALRFGLIPTVAPYLLPRIFPNLHKDLGDVSFTVSESRTDQLLAALGDGSLDLALIASDPHPGGPRLVSTPLFADEFVLATPPEDAAGDPMPLADIDGDRVLLLDEGHCFRDQAIAACALDPATRRRTFAATSLSTLVEFVANGQGITLLPQIAVRKESSGNRIRIHRLQAPGARRVLRLVWREGTPFGGIYEAVAECIRRCGAEAAMAAPA
ncbi:hydrogen peroxide-inducible genes activator [Devosia sp.]|uniref:hydrogen peroxide-inducible genes activator n=1 Tax=Devosia sp. TaxID=1871048 RepID=UPI0035B42AC0